MSQGVNHFEHQARAAKVVKLIEAVSGAAAFCGLDPKADGFAIADMLEGLSPARWADIAGTAEVPAPSVVTRLVVVAHYRELGAIAQQRVAS